MELVVIVAGIAVVWTVLALVESRRKRQSDNSRLLEEALKNPALDRATIETLTFQLTGKQPLRRDYGRNGFLAFVLAIGWIALFTGVGLLIGANVASYDHDMNTAGWIVGLVGFALVTYPFALRELEARRATQ